MPGSAFARNQKGWIKERSVLLKKFVSENALNERLPLYVA